jgi:hypothetical protein
MPTHEDSGAHRIGDLVSAIHGANAPSPVPRIHPELPDQILTTPTQQSRDLAEAWYRGRTAEHNHLPDEYLDLLDHGRPDQPVTVTIDDHQVTLLCAEPGCKRHVDTADDTWQRLSAAVRTANNGVDDGTAHRTGDWFHADLPDQVAVATWNHGGRSIRAMGPRCTPAHRRIARGRRIASLPAVGLGLLPTWLGSRAGLAAAATQTAAAASVLVVLSAPGSAPAATSMGPGGHGQGTSVVQDGAITSTTPSAAPADAKPHMAANRRSTTPDVRLTAPEPAPPTAPAVKLPAPLRSVLPDLPALPAPAQSPEPSQGPEPTDAPSPLIDTDPPDNPALPDLGGPAGDLLPSLIAPAD